MTLFNPAKSSRAHRELIPSLPKEVRASRVAPEARNEHRRRAVDPATRLLDCARNDGLGGGHVIALRYVTFLASEYPLSRGSYAWIEFLSFVGFAVFYVSCRGGYRQSCR